MGKKGRKKVATCVSLTSTLDVVSRDMFHQRMEGMSMSDSCEDCKRERFCSRPKKKKKGESSWAKEVKNKSGSPIIIKLSEAFKGGDKMKDLLKASEEDNNAEMVSYSKHHHHRYHQHHHNQRYRNHSGSSSSGGSSAVVSLKAKNSKNFNAFLSAIEKVHKKDRPLAPYNLHPGYHWGGEGYWGCKNYMPQVLLNNMISNPGSSMHGAHHPADHAYDLEHVKWESIIKSSNVSLICNNLNSEVSSASETLSTTTDDSENSSIVSTSETFSDDSDSISQDSFAEEGGAGVLSRAEVEKLAAYTTGFPLTKFGCFHHECPECVAAAGWYYPGAALSAYPGAVAYIPDATYLQGRSIIRAEADLQEETVATKETSKTTHTEEPGSKKKTKEVYVPRNLDTSDSEEEKVDDYIDVDSLKYSSNNYNNNNRDWYLSLLNLPNTHSSPSSCSSSTSSKRQRRKRKNKTKRQNAQDFLPVEGVYMDLTESDVSITVYYHNNTPSTGHLHSFFYNGYWYYPAMECPSLYAPGPYIPPVHWHIPQSYYFMEQDLESIPKEHMIPPAELPKFTATQPPQRPWIPLAHPERNKPTAIFTVMCYNVLCDKYATRQLYGYCPTWALNWEYRKKGILEEIRHYNADIISLQEVETDQFYNYFLPELKQDGYDGIFSPKSRARTMSEQDRKHVDGCAIFYRTSKFGLSKEYLIEFNQLAMANAEGSDDMLNRVMTKDNIGLAALLETKEGVFENGLPSEVRQPILVATAHIHWDPEFSDVKLIQTMMLMWELKNIVKETTVSFRPGSSGATEVNSIPLILCGDFNSLPSSGVVEYLNTGMVSTTHLDMKDKGYETCLQKFQCGESKDIYTHSFKLSQAYSEDVMQYTNYTYDFKGIIDYIYYSRDLMSPLGVLGPYDTEWFQENKVHGCPHPHIPSDHFALLCEFELPVSQTGNNSSVRGSVNSSGSNSMHIVRR
ncbi:uncharacterized protein LOC106152755 isoform X2 [Lingula anatina]|uniref:poly(A)-specific ribonuclease n=1 Tax=Lingula anatina TaxID=7574 RepID=A0A1S3H9X5_LINAN|nr:uncharacterized protein LOC106152755 isoform X1 [Lingula anatina]XP_013381925.1 uncharacterized protein LOC106152755 isoform X2 [Lingula anatina]|eukprot:XP_013381924.1 uncharacterized protein LOC106152755 isoform X1 [Lingula anatina]